MCPTEWKTFINNFYSIFSVGNKKNNERVRKNEKRLSLNCRYMSNNNNDDDESAWKERASE